ncbi:MAG TPA: Gfo/Idh/MocA family oxidoreductase [Polyangiaceae bacterium]|nr:Gfo/Idh/MocA family oxidoreductase [Polyangiaceae bacterium]
MTPARKEAASFKIRRIALLGYGAMGQRHVRALRAWPERLVTLGGVYDADPSVIPSDLRAYTSEAEAIADADVLFVATPIQAHADTVLRALTAGCDVFVEKPIGATAEEASAMVEAAEKSGRRLFVGHSERFNPVVRALRRELMTASIRSLTFCRVGAPRSRSRDVLLNLAVHDFDLASYLTDSRAFARAASGREDAADVLLSTERGCRARVHVAREGERERWLRVATDSAIYHGDLLRFRLTMRDRASQRERELELDTEEPLVAQTRAVFDALDGRPSEIATGYDGARAVRVAEKCLTLLTTSVVHSPATDVQSLLPDHPG